MNRRTDRIGIVGFGNRGVGFVAPILNESIANQITTIVDPDMQRARHFLEQSGSMPADEIERVTFLHSLDQVEPGTLDVLMMTAHERIRTQLFAQCVGTGAHIYVEKGLSHDLQGGAEVMRGMRHLQPGQQVMMGFNFRYQTVNQTVRDLVADGRIGRVLHAQYTEMLNFHHGGSYFMRFHRDVNQSGGMLATKGCHNLDLLGYILGARPARVFAAQYARFFGLGGDDARERCGTCDRTQDCDFDRLRTVGNRIAKRKYSHLYLDSDKLTADSYAPDVCVWREDTQLADLSQLMLEYDNGVPATFSQVLFAPVSGRSLKVYGCDGAISLDEPYGTLTLTDRWNRKTETFDFPTLPPGDTGGHGGGDDEIIRRFFAGIRSGTPPDCQVSDGAWALATAYAAYASHANEQWTAVAPLYDQMLR